MKKIDYRILIAIISIAAAVLQMISAILRCIIGGSALIIALTFVISVIWFVCAALWIWMYRSDRKVKAQVEELHRRMSEYPEIKED